MGLVELPKGGISGFGITFKWVLIYILSLISNYYFIGLYGGSWVSFKFVC